MINFERREHYTVEDLRRVVAILRSPEGCPWDKVQTHRSIRRNLIEEAYEAAEGIDTNDPDILQEELGDVLMQVVFHASIEEDAGRFTLDDVADAACKKLIFRHPNIFGPQSDTVGESPAKSWEDLKREEKGQKTLADTLRGVSSALPALWRAEKVLDKLAKGTQAPLGDEFLCHVGPLTQEELGRRLLDLVMAAWRDGIDAEAALHAAIDAVIRQSEEPSVSGTATLPESIIRLVQSQ